MCCVFFKVKNFQTRKETGWTSTIPKINEDGTEEAQFVHKAVRILLVVMVWMNFLKAKKHLIFLEVTEIEY